MTQLERTDPPHFDPPTSLVFEPSPAAARYAGAITVLLPSGIRSKRRLFANFQRQLDLPDYFGWNWDALDECLRDLEWLPAGSHVLLVHQDLPFAPASADQVLYLELLHDAIPSWSPRDPYRLGAIFPTATQPEITRILKTHTGEV